MLKPSVCAVSLALTATLITSFMLQKGVAAWSGQPVQLTPEIADKWLGV